MASWSSLELYMVMTSILGLLYQGLVAFQCIKAMRTTINQIDSYKFHQELEGLQIEELFILIDVVNIFVAMASISQMKLFGIYWDQNDLLLLVLSLTGILDL